MRSLEMGKGREGQDEEEHGSAGRVWCPGMGGNLLTVCGAEEVEDDKGGQNYGTEVRLELRL